jgi:hypothetical protein
MTPGAGAAAAALAGARRGGGNTALSGTFTETWNAGPGAGVTR